MKAGGAGAEEDFPDEVVEPFAVAIFCREAVLLQRRDVEIAARAGAACGTMHAVAIPADVRRSMLTAAGLGMVGEKLGMNGARLD